MKNQKFSRGDTPAPPSMARASGPRVRATPEKSPDLLNQQPHLQFASYGTDISTVILLICIPAIVNIILNMVNEFPVVIFVQHVVENSIPVSKSKFMI